jgi:aspartyl-tRNA synthetase
MKSNTLLIIIFGLVLLFLTGCTSKIEEIKSEEFVGKEITIKGVVKNPIKLGSLSGYTLEDETGKITIASQEIPIEGKTITVSGILEKEVIIGYYLDVDK